MNVSETRNASLVGMDATILLYLISRCLSVEPIITERRLAFGASRPTALALT
jgi:hypothetical protein